MPDEAKPDPKPSEWTAYVRPPGVVVLTRADGTKIDVGPGWSDARSIAMWLNAKTVGGDTIAELAGALASKPTPPAPDALAKLAAIGEKTGECIWFTRFPTDRSWDVRTDSYCTKSYPTPESAVAEAAAHFGVADDAAASEAPAAPKVEPFDVGAFNAALKAMRAMERLDTSKGPPLDDEEIAFVRRAIASEAKRREAAEVDRLYEGASKAPRAEPAAMTTHEKLHAIRVRLNASSIGVTLWGSTGEYRVEVKDRCDDHHFGPDADTYDEAVVAAYRKFCQPPTPGDRP